MSLFDFSILRQAQDTASSRHRRLTNRARGPGKGKIRRNSGRNKRTPSPSGRGLGRGSPVAAHQPRKDKPNTCPATPLDIHRSLLHKAAFRSRLRGNPMHTMKQSRIVIAGTLAAACLRLGAAVPPLRQRRSPAPCEPRGTHATRRAATPSPWCVRAKSIWGTRFSTKTAADHDRAEDRLLGNHQG